MWEARNTGGHSAKNRRNFPSHKHKCNMVSLMTWKYGESYDLEKPQGFETVTVRSAREGSGETPTQRNVINSNLK